MLIDLQETKDYNGTDLTFVSEGQAWRNLNYLATAYSRKNIFE